MKFLVNGLFWYIVFLSGVLLALRRHVGDRGRRWIRAAGAITMLLAIVSMPFVGRGLAASLRPAATPATTVAPEFIFVLGGGYKPGPVPQEDVLNDECAIRVLHAVTVWHRFPTAHIVFSGAAYEYASVRSPDRMVRLMAALAASAGVPPALLILEPRSRNTREHPVEALKLAGVTPASPIAVVTSDYHMPRARREFCRYFRSVRVDPSTPLPRDFAFRDVIPDASALGTNTDYIREWVGQMWYSVLAIGGPAPRC